jgi:CRISPR-associated protein Csx10
VKALKYRITLLEPVLVTSLDGDPNSSVAYDYLPGSVLRGAWIALTSKYEGDRPVDANDPLWRRRFFDGQTRFLNGYLVIAGKRSLPAPRSWTQVKYPTDDAASRLITDHAQSGSDPQTPKSAASESGTKTKSLDRKFCVSDSSTSDGKVLVKTAAHTIQVHTERDRKAGRPRGANQGTVYRYDALAAGQVFEAAILCNEDGDADYFSELLMKTPELLIGGARSAGYGRVKLTQESIEPTYREAWTALQVSVERLTITLLSDVILRDDQGHYATDAVTFAAAIAKRFNIDSGLLPLGSVFKADGVVGGFNRKWGLPLPQTPTLAMGSVFVYALSVSDEDAARSIYEALETAGIGERRAEGFGRVAVNLWDQTTYTVADEQESETNSADQPNQPLGKESADLWARMESRLKKQGTDQEQLKAAQELGSKMQQLPPKSQINRLRQIVTAQLVSQNPLVTPIEEFLGTIKGKKAEKHFMRARVDGKPLAAWLREQIKAANTQDAHYAALRLIDATLAIAADKKKKEEVQHG